MWKEVVLALSLASISQGLRKVWQPSVVVDWRAQESCSKAIQMPSHMGSFVSLEGVEKLDIDRFYMAEEAGAVVLGENTMLVFQENSEKTCNVNIPRPPLQPWFSTKNWKTLFQEGDVQFNKATPDSEKVPCRGDVAVFPKANYLVDMQFTQKVTVGGIEIEGQTNEGAANFIHSHLGQSRFVNADETVVDLSPCDSSDNCPCDLDSVLCQNEAKFCPVPKCLEPIQPGGFCCKVCGAVAYFYVGSEKFHQAELHRKINIMLQHSEADFNPDSVEYFASLLPDKMGQLVVVDKDGYDDRVSPKVAEYIKHRLLDLMFKNSSSTFLKSGRAYDPGSGLSPVTSVLLPLLLVLIFLGALYFVNYNENIIPRALAMVRIRQLNPSNFIFARFDNNPNVEDVDVNLAPEGEKGTETAFNNPMFEDVDISTLESALEGAVTDLPSTSSS